MHREPGRTERATSSVSSLRLGVIVLASAVLILRTPAAELSGNQLAVAACHSPSVRGQT